MSPLGTFASLAVLGLCSPTAALVAGPDVEALSADELLERLGPAPTDEVLASIAARLSQAAEEGVAAEPVELADALVRARAALRDGDLGAAERALTHASTVADAHWGSTNWRAVAYAVRARECAALAQLEGPRRRALDRAFASGREADAHYAAGRWDEAAVAGRARLDTLEEAGLSGTLIYAGGVESLGQAFLRGHAWAEAERVLRHGLSVAPEVRDSVFAHGLQQWGYALSELGDERRALRALRHALAAEARLDRPPSERLLGVCMNLGTTAYEAEDVSTAALMAEAAHAIARAIYGESDPRTAKPASLLVATLERTGRRAEAEAVARRSVEVVRAGADDEELVRALSNLAHLLFIRGEREAATRALDEAVLVGARLGEDHPSEAHARFLTASMLRGGDPERARSEAERALAIFRRREMAHEIARVELFLGTYVESDRRALESLRRTVAASDGDVPVRTYLHLADLERKLGEHAAASDSFRRALERVDPEDQDRRRIILSHGGRTLLRAGRTEEAIDWLTAGFEESLVSLTGGARSSVEGGLHSASLGLVETGSLLAQALVEGGRAAEALAVVEQVANRALDELLAERDASHASGSATGGGLRDSVRAGEVCLTWAWSDLAVVALLLRDGTSPPLGAVLARTPADAARLDVRVRALADVLREARAVPDGALGGLRDAIVPAEWLPFLADAQRVAVVPAGPLHGFPLEALRFGDATRDPIVLRVPSPRVYHRARAATDAQSSADTALVVGAADLPGVRGEVAAVADLLRAAGQETRVLMGLDATLASFEGALRPGAPRWLHIATHGWMGTAEAPLDARLQLGGAELTLEHLLREWPTVLEGSRLAVLSACETQRGPRVGDARPALTWGFLAAGCPTVVATLWKVDDDAARLLMTRFYESLLGTFEGTRSAGGRAYEGGTPLPPAEALDEARRWLAAATFEDLRPYRPRSAEPATRGAAAAAAVARDVAPDALRPYAHPRFWAAFVLIGSPD